VRRRVALCLAAGAATLGVWYALALLASLALASATPPPRRPHMLLDPDLYVPDPAIGYRMAAGWRGLLRDGVLSVPSSTNSHGHRDGEPEAMDAPRRVLLLGDSFAFGFSLADDETVDRQIERLSGGRVDVYDAGVVGYGAPGVLETFRRCDFGFTDALYLFFQNDLQDDQLLPDGGFAFAGGTLLPRLRPDGTRYRPEEYPAFLRDRLAMLAPPTRGERLRALATLAPLRERIERVAGRLTESLVRREPRDEDLLEGARATYRPENVARALAYTDAMQALARERGLRFAVAVAPSRAEARWQRDATLTEAYVAGLRARGTPVLQLRSRLTAADYYEHDFHWNPAGARTAAAAILAWLDAGPE